jgi:hypothetical protein
MAEEIRHSDGRIEHPGVRFEPSDVSARWIFSILAGAVIFAAVVELVVLAFFDSCRDHLAEVNRSHYPLAPEPSINLPRGPRLEQVERLSGDKTANVYVREAAKLRSLDTYGPTETKGFIHIPIDRAMQIMVEKNMLKARPEPPPAERGRSEGLIDAGASNSGRLLKGGGK